MQACVLLKKPLISCAILGAALTLGDAALANTFTYSDFSDTSNLQLNGSTATIMASPIAGNPLRLTNSTSQGGSAFVTNPITLNNDVSFSSAFSFRISDPVGLSDGDGQGADGLVFVVQTVANNVGGIGGGMGYQNISNSLGIEFDTWNNGSWDDNNGNHVGINLNGNIDSVMQANIGTSNPGRLNNGAIWYSWVDYNGLTDLLEVRLATTGIRPVAALMSYSVDLTSVLGNPNAYVGFTSGTGAAGNDHDILAWSFADNFQPFGVAEPGTLALFGLSLSMMGLYRRKAAK